jgi:hypothetical protein
MSSVGFNWARIGHNQAVRAKLKLVTAPQHHIYNSTAERAVATPSAAMLQRTKDHRPIL